MIRENLMRLKILIEFQKVWNIHFTFFGEQFLYTNYVMIIYTFDHLIIFFAKLNHFFIISIKMDKLIPRSTYLVQQLYFINLSH